MSPVSLLHVPAGGSLHVSQTRSVESSPHAAPTRTSASSRSVLPETVRRLPDAQSPQRYRPRIAQLLLPLVLLASSIAAPIGRTRSEDRCSQVLGSLAPLAASPLLYSSTLPLPSPLL